MCKMKGQKPGYLRHLLPDQPPEQPELWADIFDDVEKYILPGLCHWQHPRFHAYFPAANSMPSIMADMLSTALGCNGFSWVRQSYFRICKHMSLFSPCFSFQQAASPAITELEILMCDWIGKLLVLPEMFLHSSGIGGGVIQSSASDCILISMLAARHQAVERYKHLFEETNLSDSKIAVLSRLVAYTSKLVSFAFYSQFLNRFTGLQKSCHS
ncbi:unnamed protein product [Trichobilharzia regenti]|nr:unnamed protein product [Trichobilharzia regenti]